MHSKLRIERREKREHLDEKGARVIDCIEWREESLSLKGMEEGEERDGREEE